MDNPFGSSPVVSVGADPAGNFGEDITSGAWWPAISPAKAMEAIRIDGSVSAGRLRAALVEAMVLTIEQLGAFKIAALAAGHGDLSQVPCDQIDSESANVARFRRAVYCYAAASLAEQYRGTDISGAGNQRADLVEAPIDLLRRDAAWAIADIMGRHRFTAELV